MTETYEDYEREYNANLSRIRSFLAGTRSRVTLKECERLLIQAKKNATAMQGLAEVEGNQMKIREASQRIERDITPLSTEVARALQDSSNGGREELFYQAPEAHQRGDGTLDRDMEALIGSSHDMLTESLSLAMETEQIGNSTIDQLSRQRQQLQGANLNIARTREIANHAASIMGEMSRKAFRNKMCLYGMIGTLILLNLWALIRLFKKH
jgi:vesicle transport through interaction with t-SNAREs protein 1